MIEQDRKLVAAEPSDGIRFAHPAGQQRGDMDQRGVAGGMTEAVVEHLEPVEIDEQHRGGVLVALQPGDGQFELAKEAAAIGDGDQRVAMGQPVKLCAASFKLRDPPVKLGKFSLAAGQFGHFLHRVRLLPWRYRWGCITQISRIGNLWFVTVPHCTTSNTPLNPPFLRGSSSDHER